MIDYSIFRKNNGFDNTEKSIDQDKSNVLQNVYKYQSQDLKINSKNTNLMKFITKENNTKSDYNIDRSRNLTRLENNETLSRLSKRGNNLPVLNKSLPICVEIKNKMLNSNVFYEDNNSNIVKLQPYQQLRKINDSIITNIPVNKSSEFYMLSNIRKKYGCTTESNSGWKTKDSIINLQNHSSVSYSIINPKIRNQSRTKQEIIMDSKYSPIPIQKSVCEFSDLIKNSSNNTNKIYIDNYKNDNNLFLMRNNVCNCHGNLFKSYKGVIDKTFFDKK